MKNGSIVRFSLSAICVALCTQPVHALSFTPEFQVTTGPITTAKAYSFAISAKGEFYVDCGDSGDPDNPTVLKNNASGNAGTPVSTVPLITHSSAGYTVYWCDLPVNANGYTISFAGDADAYVSGTGTTQNVAAITFYTNNSGKQLSEIITSMSGSLSAIFPTIGNGNTLATQPRFTYSFYNARNLTGQLSSSLFRGLIGPFAAAMFRRTFSNTGLTGYVPHNLFAQLDPDGLTMSDILKYIFYGSGSMLTYNQSCPAGTQEYTLSYAGNNNTNLSGKLVCESTSACTANQYAYNGTCYDKCDGTNMNKLQTSHTSGLSFNLVLQKPTTPAINVRSGNTTCYIPLESGAGSSPAFNVQYGNNTYHAISLN